MNPSRNLLTDTFLTFLKLGLTSFGGPVAHIAIFRDELVTRRGWFDDRFFGELLAMCQLLPGPTSSQFGIAVGTHRAGYLGGVAAWIGFTLPSAILMTLFAILVVDPTVLGTADWFYGLKLAVVIIVGNALIDMARQLCPDLQRKGMALIGALVATLLGGFVGQFLALILGAILGAWFIKNVATTDDRSENGIQTDDNSGNLKQEWLVSRACLVLFVAGLIILPILAAVSANDSLSLFDRFYKAGALVFGGGHVVLPLLDSQFVETGWLERDSFVAGYGAAQVVPGPLFSIASYLGATVTHGPGGVIGAALATLAIFAPSFLLVWGVTPVWLGLARMRKARVVLAGVNAAVVGLLLAALYDPVATSAFRHVFDVVFVVAGWLILRSGRLPVWVLVPAYTIGGAVLVSAIPALS